MYCPDCGKKYDDEDNFCEFCGHEFKTKKEVVKNKKLKNKLDPLISVNISKTQTLIFYDNFLVYKGDKVNYRDIIGISYSLVRVRHRINFIPTYASSSFQIQLETDRYQYRADSTNTPLVGLQVAKQEEEEKTFATLVYVLENLVKPFVLVNQLIRFGKSGEIKIGDSLTITTEGFFKKRLWRKPKFLFWNQYYNSVLHQGMMHLYRYDPEEKYKLYFSCPTSVMNAVILPDLLKIIYQNGGIVGQKEVRFLERKKEKKKNTLQDKEFIDTNNLGHSCPSCGALETKKQKFCVYCGNKLS